MAPASPSSKAARSDRVDEWLEVRGRDVSPGGEVDELAHETMRSFGSLAKATRSPQIDGLSRDEELEGDHPCGEVYHLCQAPGRQRRHGSAVLDPLRPARTHHL